MIRPSKRAFLITLIVLLAILILYGVLRMAYGPILPDFLDQHLPDALIVAAVVIMLWNRQIIKDEKREAEERKEREKLEATAASEDSAGQGPDASSGQEPGGGDGIAKG